MPTPPPSPAVVSAAIDRYASGAATPGRAIAGLSRDQLLAHPVPGTWSIQEIVVHLLDSDLAATHRMRRIAAEEQPLLIAYDETAFAKTLSYDRDDLALVCRLFEVNREFTAAFLRRLPPEAFARTGVHNQTGIRSLLDLVGAYANHVDHHMKFLLEKKKLVGG